MITVGYDKELMERAGETKRLIQQKKDRMNDAISNPFKIVFSNEDMFSESCVLKQLKKLKEKE